MMVPIIRAHMSIFREHKTIADRSASDRRRHKKKIEDAIKEGIHNIVSDERTSVSGAFQVSKSLKIPSGPPYEVTCQICSSLFKVEKPSQIKKRKYCSRTCANTRGSAKKEKVRIECAECFQTFEKIPCKSGVRFCSNECRGKNLQKRHVRTCLTCEINFDTTLGKDKKYCSKSCHHISLSQGQALENMKMTNLKKYGALHVSQVQEIKTKKHHTMKKNRSHGKSKVEDNVYEILVRLYGINSVERQSLVNGWAIDFFIKPIDTYLQVDGVYWHGLDRDLEAIRASDAYRDKYILKVIQKDKEQNKWFAKNNVRLVRITDLQLKSKNIQEELLIVLRGVI
jgi:hypothetical protein